MDIRKFVDSLSSSEKDELLQVLASVRLSPNQKLMVYEFVYIPPTSSEAPRQYINAIKLIREYLGVGLKEAKDILDSRHLRTFSDNFVVNGHDYRKLLLEQGWELRLS